MMKERIQKTFDCIHRFFYQAYGSTKAGIEIMFMIVNALVINICIHRGIANSNGILSFLVIGIVTCAVTALLKVISWFLQRFFVFYGLWNLFLIAVFFMLVSYTLIEGITPEVITYVITALVLFMEIPFARCTYAFVKNRKHNLFVILPLCLLLVVNVSFGVFLAWDGKDTDYVQSCYKKNGKINIGEKQVDYEGKYQAKTFDYGMKEHEKVRTKTVDMSPYLESHNALRRWTREQYLGYGAEEIPLEGRVWYPEEEGAYPILFIIHGNAHMVKQSYLGYDYLGKYLASDGYIVVSVNENYCNYHMGFGFSNENDARAILLLENIKEVLKWNGVTDNPLYQKIDENNIAIAGHSRGGEAVAIANEFNTMTYYPDDANQIFDYHFPIKTVFAIAPTSEQYRPSDRTVSVRNVNYFLIHGTYDQDVTSMMGINQYNHVELDSGCMKAYLYVAGANHGQFNTNWGRYDTSVPGKLILNTKPILRPEEQKMILKQYLKVCLDTTLKGKVTNQDFIWEIDAYGKELPKTVYVQAFQNSTYEPLAEYEEDGDLTTTTSNDTIMAKGYSEWAEVNSNQFEDYNSDNHAVYLKWDSTREASYELKMPPRDLSHKYLLFDVMNLRGEDTMNSNPQMLDFTIQFMDSNGKSATVSLKNQKTVYPASKVMYSKMVVLLNRVSYRYRFQTVSIDLEELQKMFLEVDFTGIEKISILCNKNPNGKILLDHIGLQS